MVRASADSHRPGPLVTGLFAEGPGYAIRRPRGTDDWLLILTLGGVGRFGHAGGVLRAEPGDLVALAPGTLHDYATDWSAGRWELVWCHVDPRPHWLGWLDWPEAAAGLRRRRLAGEAALEAQRAFEQAHALATGARPGRVGFALNALERVLLWAREAGAEGERQRLDRRVERAMDWLCRHLAEPVGVDDVAAAVHLSRSRLSHLFAEQVGQGPMQYLEAQRLDRARQLLELTPHPVQAIAGMVGYDSAFYFSKRFKRRHGLSPRAYRAQLGLTQPGPRRG